MSADPVEHTAEDEVYDEGRLIDILTWTVIPALPGTRLEWKADWCKEGSVTVHAWLVKIDVFGRRLGPTDTSCINGYPMVLNASGELQAAHECDLDGKPGEVIEP